MVVVRLATLATSYPITVISVRVFKISTSKIAC